MPSSGNIQRTILGEGEAQRRMQAYPDLLTRDDVEYISVKVSSVFSQLNLIAFDQTKERVKERLHRLYHQAMAYHYHHPDGRVTPKFVNLDMEAYADLYVTVDAFKQQETTGCGDSARQLLRLWRPVAQREIGADRLAVCPDLRVRGNASHRLSAMLAASHRSGSTKLG